MGWGLCFKAGRVAYKDFVRRVFLAVVGRAVGVLCGVGACRYLV
ncbi:hypothetical protein [Bartonella krasnovii]|nr:hypothetical protein [Bartonella krasnovii]